MSLDPYLDLSSGVLRNRLGITDDAELRQVEAALTASRIYDLALTPLAGEYDLAHLQAFHHHIFSYLYDWAGELRTVTIGRGAQMFCRPEHIAGDAEELFAWLARSGLLRGLSREDFLDGLTELLSDLNSLHPFRDGNGRTQRAFVAQLARAAGHPVRWALLDREANVAASEAAHEGDVAPLRALLGGLVASPASGGATGGPWPLAPVMPGPASRPDARPVPVRLVAASDNRAVIRPWEVMHLQPILPLYPDVDSALGDS